MKLKLPDTRWLFVLAVALLCAAGVVLHRLPVVPAELWMGPTPAPAPSVSQPPAPTPVAGAITILADDIPILTLPGREDAQALLNEWLKESANAVPEAETLVSAVFDKNMTLREARSGENPVSPEQARAALFADPALCPVRLVTRTVTAESVTFSAEETKDARIPKGSRLIVQLGRAGERLSTVEKTYLNGKLQGAPVVTVQDTLPPAVQRVAVGTFTAENTGGSQGEKGPAAPKGFQLTLPMKAEIISNFGMSKTGMNYGIDLKCKVGDAISAPAAGTVVFAGKRGSYGFVLEIDHGDGFVTRIAPLKDCTLKIGDTVAAGSSIGKVSAPEDEEDSPYLHMELLIGGIPYNPRQYLS
jgi:murein DD-endopeptidase MepM/ murein hydrolase activator NlpD